MTSPNSGQNLKKLKCKLRQKNNDEVKRVDKKCKEMSS